MSQHTPHTRQSMLYSRVCDHSNAGLMGLPNLTTMARATNADVSVNSAALEELRCCGDRSSLKRLQPMVAGVRVVGNGNQISSRLTTPKGMGENTEKRWEGGTDCMNGSKGKDSRSKATRSSALTATAVKGNSEPAHTSGKSTPGPWTSPQHSPTPLYNIEIKRSGRNRPWRSLPHYCDIRQDAEETARLITLRTGNETRVVKL